MTTFQNMERFSFTTETEMSCATATTSGSDPSSGRSKSRSFLDRDRRLEPRHHFTKFPGIEKKPSPIDDFSAFLRHESETFRHRRSGFLEIFASDSRTRSSSDEGVAGKAIASKDQVVST